MGTFYIDYENGNDANDGSTWALAWKTITTGATVARIAPGDEIRIAKSPDPVNIGNATWTNLSKTVTLATAQTATVDNCETAWTAANGATVTRQGVATDAKEGSYCMQIAVDASPGTDELQAYYTIAETDFSAYQKLSFWIKNSAAIANATTWKICLCSDDAGTTIVDTFFIIAIPSTGQWLPLTITKNGGGNLGASIKSVALYTSTSAPTNSSYVRLDNIIACTTNGLNLQSLISKNNLAKGGSEGWYCIQSIVGTTILLDNGSSTKSNAGKGYYGTTETITTYARETIKTDLISSFVSVQEIQDSGNVSNPISFTGGYNTSTTEIDGETFFDGLATLGVGIKCSYDRSFINIYNICCTRYAYGMYFDGSYFININSLSLNGNYTGCKSSGYGCIINITSTSNNTYNGLEISGFGKFTIGNCNSNLENGITMSGSLDVIASNICNNSYSGISNNNAACSNSKIRNATFKNNSTASVSVNQIVSLYLENCVLGDTTEFYTSYNSQNVILYSQNHDNSGYNWIFTDSGTINSLASNRVGGSGNMYKFITTSANRHIYYPLVLSIAKIAVNANKLVTVKAWMKKDHATNIGARLVCRAYQIAGVSSDVVTTKANDTDWEELTITFTPTEDGVVEIEAQAYYIVGNSNAYVENVTITQAD